MPKLVLPEESQASTPPAPAVEETESKVTTEPPAEASPPAGGPEPLDPILTAAVESQPKVKPMQVKDEPKTEASEPETPQPAPTPKKRRGGLPVLLGFAAAAVVGLMALSSLGQGGGEPSGRYQPEQPAYTPTRTSQPRRNILD